MHVRPFFSSPILKSLFAYKLPFLLAYLKAKAFPHFNSLSMVFIIRSEFIDTM